MENALQETIDNYYLQLNTASSEKIAELLDKIEALNSDVVEQVTGIENESIILQQKEIILEKLQNIKTEIQNTKFETLYYRINNITGYYQMEYDKEIVKRVAKEEGFIQKIEQKDIRTLTMYHSTHYYYISPYNKQSYTTTSNIFDLLEWNLLPGDILGLPQKATFEITNVTKKHNLGYGGSKVFLIGIMNGETRYAGTQTNVEGAIDHDQVRVVSSIKMEVIKRGPLFKKMLKAGAFKAETDNMVVNESEILEQIQKNEDNEVFLYKAKTIIGSDITINANPAFNPTFPVYIGDKYEKNNETWEVLGFTEVFSHISEPVLVMRNVEQNYVTPIMRNNSEEMATTPHMLKLCGFIFKENGEVAKRLGK